MPQVNSSAVFRYRADGPATIVGRHEPRQRRSPGHRRGADGEESVGVGRVLRTGAPARVDDWGGLRDQSEIAERSSASATARPPRRRSSSPARSGERSRSPSEIRLPTTPRTARRVLRARLARRRERTGARGSDRQPHAAGRGGRRAAPPAGAQPPRRRPAAPGQRGRQAARRAHPARLQARHQRRLLDEALRELGAGLEELREIARGLHPAILGEHGLRPRARSPRRAAPGRRSRSTCCRSGCPSTWRRRPTTSSPKR